MYIYFLTHAIEDYISYLLLRFLKRILFLRCIHVAFFFLKKPMLLCVLLTGCF